MKSGRKILFDLFLDLGVNGNLFAVFYLFYTFSVGVLLRYLSGNSNRLEVVLLAYGKSNQAFCNLADFSSLCLCGTDLSVVKQICNLVSEQSFSLG